MSDTAAVTFLMTWRNTVST